MLHVNDLVFRYGGHAIFDGASAAVPAGHKVGLVGRNGSGKSTLLRLIAGELAPDGGAVALSPRTRVGRLLQEPPAGPGAPIDFVLAADGERAALAAEAETADDPHRVAEIHDRLVALAAHSAPARAAAILAGLGFDDAAQKRPLDEFSGGWRMRVALAACLFAAPDLLLLDEPSNHLDLEARLWLEGFLAAYPGTLVLVSHDRDLLNAIVDQIVHIDMGKLVTYRGDYDAFERAWAERRALAAASHARQLAQRRHVQSFIDRFRYKASKARQAQSRLKLLERMTATAPLAADEEIAFDFPAPDPLPSPLVALDGAGFGYAPDRPVLRRLDLRLDMDDRIALVGANGNGKSTLLRLLAGRLRPQAGSVRRLPRLRIGYFDQEQAEAFDASRTAYAHLAAEMKTASEVQVRAHLGRFGLSQDRAERRVGELSGGERSRLLFALVTRAAPHLLLLDEPTNHLDIEAREALIAALNAYDGAVVLVSHDTRFIAACADRLWLVADGGCAPFAGDLDDYRRLVAAERGAEANPSAQTVTGPRGFARGAEANPSAQTVTGPRGFARGAEANPSAQTVTGPRGFARGGEAARKQRPAAPSRKDARRAAAEARARAAPLKQAARAAEARVEKLLAEKAALEKRLADPATYEAGAGQVAELTRARAALGRALEAAEKAWGEAQQAIDEQE